MGEAGATGQKERTMSAQEARKVAARMRAAGLKDIYGRRLSGTTAWCIIATGFAGERVEIRTIAAWTAYVSVAA